MSNVRKRQRSANFTPGETKLLMSLVAEFTDIIKNPKTDNQSASVKQAVWEEITCRFNLQTEEEFRTAKVLREKYRNVKQSNRKKRAANGADGLCEAPQTQPQANLLTAIKEEASLDMYDDYERDAATSSRQFSDSANSCDNEKIAASLDSRCHSDYMEITAEPIKYNVHINKMSKAKRTTGKKPKKTLDEAIKRAQLLLTRKQVQLCEVQIELFKLKLEKAKREL